MHGRAKFVFRDAGLKARNGENGKNKVLLNESTSTEKAEMQKQPLKAKIFAGWVRSRFFGGFSDDLDLDLPW